MLAVACCGIPRLGDKPSMVVQLWKWFTGWTEGFGIDALPADGPLCMWVDLSKINSASVRRRISIKMILFFPSHSSINLRSSSSVLLACLSNAELIMF
jgi:hypothetical protein